MLWPLVVLRAAVLVVSGEQQAAIDGVNDYVPAPWSTSGACSSGRCRSRPR